MAYLTLFSLPKAFSDPHIALIQRNALASWRHLGPDVEVLVMGDDPGVAEAASELGAEHVGQPAVNEFGTPLLDWAFREAARRGSGELLCYVNAEHDQVRLTGSASVVIDRALLDEIWRDNPLLRHYLGSPGHPELIVYRITPTRVRFMREWALEYHEVPLSG